MTAFLDWLNIRWHDATNQLWYTLHSTNVGFDTLQTRRTLDCLLFLTPLSAIAVTDLVFVFCVDGSYLVDQIYEISLLVHGCYAIIIVLLWNYFWTIDVSQKGENDILERFVVNFGLQSTRTASSVVLLCFVLASTRVSESAILTRFYLIVFLCADVISCIRSWLMSYTLNELCNNLLSADHWSTILNYIKIFTLILLYLYLYKHKNVNDTGINALLTILILLCVMRNMCTGGCCWDVFRYKQLFLVVFSVVGFYLMFFMFIEQDHLIYRTVKSHNI